MIGLAIALILVGAIILFIIPAVGWVLGPLAIIAGIVLVVVYFVGDRGRAAEPRP